MSAVPALPALFVTAGLVHGASVAAPVPPPQVAEAQVRAINHRFVHAGIDVDGALIEALTHDDFVQTRADGAWLTRTEFMEWVRRQVPHPEARVEEQRVRLFGPLALVHGVYVGPAATNGSPARRRYTDVVLWSGTAWQLVSAQDTTVNDASLPGLVTGTEPASARWPGQDPTGEDDHGVLHALNDHYVRAFREADVAWYAEHLAADYLVVQSDGSLHDRAAALERFARPTFATSMRSFPVDRVKVRRFDDVALIHAENAYELLDGRRGISRYTDIWHQRDGRWRCVAAHITPHNAPTHEALPADPGR